MDKPIIIGFYGYSNSGKTMLIERLIRELSSREIAVAAIKLSGHPIGMDTQGKDTYRFTQAGANPVVLSSSLETDIKINKPLGMEEIIRLLKSIQIIDIIIIEGAKDTEIQKIRIGDIELRENTIWTYDGNFGELINKILNGGE
jgi:molybdopterin-guanine dinucleotide biosynthesis adapter protein